MRRIRQNGLSYYVFDLLVDEAGLHHAIFTRHGGVSHPPFATLNLSRSVGDAPESVAENHRRATAALGISPERLCTSWQVHGAETLVLDRPNWGQRPLPQADILLTARLDVWLSMRFADCVPVLLYDPVRRAAGLAHAGWRGTLAGAAQAAVSGMGTVFGSRPGDLLAGIGPAIGPCCYRVGTEVAEAFMEAFGREATAWLRPAENGVRYLDLWSANRWQLVAGGVRQIETAELCTAHRRDEFFSHRGDQGRTGRFGVVIGLTEGDA